MKPMKPRTVFLCLVVLGCMPSIGYAQSLQEAIDESLIVPLAALEAQADSTRAWPEYEAVRENAEAAFDKWHMAIPRARDEAVLKYMSDTIFYSSAKVKAIEDKWEAKRKAAWDKYKAASAKASALSDEIFAARDTAIANAKAKARQGKKRARHCRVTLKPVDDHLEIVEIVECVQTMEAIADMCSTATNQFRVEKNLNASIETEMHTLKEYATQCVTENITGFSALMIYEVKREDKDQYAGLIEKCRQEETNTLGVLGYQFIWPCFKRYLDMIDEPATPEPEEISPEPVKDSETLPKVKA